jgi:hypothetical protein
VLGGVSIGISYPLSRNRCASTIGVEGGWTILRPPIVLGAAGVGEEEGGWTILRPPIVLGAAGVGEEVGEGKGGSSIFRPPNVLGAAGVGEGEGEDLGGRREEALPTGNSCDSGACIDLSVAGRGVTACMLLRSGASTAKHSRSAGMLILICECMSSSCPVCKCLGSSCPVCKCLGSSCPVRSCLSSSSGICPCLLLGGGARLRALALSRPGRVLRAEAPLSASLAADSFEESSCRCHSTFVVVAVGFGSRREEAILLLKSLEIK